MSTNFVEKMLDKYKKGPFTSPTARRIVSETRCYFQARYKRDVRAGIDRKITGLACAQSTLSKIKKCFQDLTTSATFLRELRLPKADMVRISARKQQRLHTQGTNLPTVPALSMIRDCRKILRSPDIQNHRRGLKLMALACLTGRRMVELILTAKFHQPRKQHQTPRKYWAYVTGLAKQRSPDPSGIEMPLLADRDSIVKGIMEIRQLYPAPPRTLSPQKQKTWVNNKYAKEVSRVMQKYCDTIGTLHNFRKFYALVAATYFQENNTSVLRLASDYLGHKQLSPSVLHYLNFIVSDNTRDQMRTLFPG
jgi:hypothetical protein